MRAQRALVRASLFAKKGSRADRLRLLRLEPGDAGFVSWSVAVRRYITEIRAVIEEEVRAGDEEWTFPNGDSSCPVVFPEMV